MTISEKDQVDLAFSGLRSYLKKKLEGHNFLTLAHLQQEASTQESRSKEVKHDYKTYHSMHVVEYDLDISYDDFNNILAAEFVWRSKVKSFACDSIKPIHKN